MGERRIYKTASGLVACKVETSGKYQNVKMDETGVWPLTHPVEARIKVTIGKLVYKRKS